MTARSQAPSPRAVAGCYRFVHGAADLVVAEGDAGSSRVDNTIFSSVRMIFFVTAGVVSSS